MLVPTRVWDRDPDVALGQSKSAQLRDGRFGLLTVGEECRNEGGLGGWDIGRGSCPGNVPDSPDSIAYPPNPCAWR